MAETTTAAPAISWGCRWCRAVNGRVVLDLGRQPAADLFPRADDPVPDPTHPLRMVLCDRCRLVQLEDDPTSAEEPRGVEPDALRRQAQQAVEDLCRAGLAQPRMTVTEFPSPHGGSWLAGLVARGLTESRLRPADLVVDSLGLMHDPDQRTALALRLARLAPDGVLALHVHTLATILRDRTWNALRHGHFAYFSLPVLIGMVADVGLAPVGAWTYSLYGGTTMLALAREGSATIAQHPAGAADALHLEEAELAAGVTDAATVAGLGSAVGESASALRAYVRSRVGMRIAGYGAASRAVALLGAAGLGPDDVLAIGDSSPAKAGRAMPGSRIPIVEPRELVALQPDRVLLFVPDLLDEVRSALPGVEEIGRWVVAEPTPREVGP